MISNIRKNTLGINFEGKFGKMRKAQKFVTYPIHRDSSGETLLIQSDHRIATIRLSDGKTVMSANHAQYANSVKLMADIANGVAECFTIPMEELETLLQSVR